MIKNYKIIVKENKKAIADWDSSKFEATDDYYGISSHSCNKDDCINFVKGSILHAVAHSFSDKVPDALTIIFVVIEKKI